MTRRKKSKRLTYIQVAALVIAAAVYAGVRLLPSSGGAARPDGLVYVERAVDGDTLKLAGGERVRLIGVDTPEVHYSSKLERDAKRSGKDIATIQALGRKSSAFTKKLCEGKRVRLEYDVQRQDRYGRTLAYVYLEDGTFVNARIIEDGYGSVMTIPPNVRHTDLFLRLERDARAGRKGLWAEGA